MCLIPIPCAGTKLSRRQSGGQGDVHTLFYVYLEFSNRISISICKLYNYIDCVTSNGKVQDSRRFGYVNVANRGDVILAYCISAKGCIDSVWVYLFAATELFG